MSSSFERFEIRMSGKALKEGWIGDEDKRAEVLNRLYEIALSPHTADRNRLMAFKAIAAAERVSQGWADLDLKQKALEGGQNINILAVAADLNSALAGRGLSDAEHLPDPLPE